MSRFSTQERLAIEDTYSRLVDAKRAEKDAEISVRHATQRLEQAETTWQACRHQLRNAQEALDALASTQAGVAVGQ